MDDLPNKMNFPTTLEEMLAFKHNAHPIYELRVQLGTPDLVLPFVGAGLSMEYKMKGWKQYLQHHAKDRGIGQEIEALLTNNDYEGAAMALKNRMGDLEFQLEIQREYGVKRIESFEPKGAGKYLHRLTRGPIITTNYDRLIEKTLEHWRLGYEVAKGAQVTATQDAITQKKRIVLKIHGDAEEESHRILSGDDYDKYYGSAEGKGFDPEKELPKVLLRLMSGTPLLFLGCSLGEDRTLKVLHSIGQSLPGLRHFAIVEAPSSEDAYQLFRTHLSNHRITPIWFGPGEFHLIEKLLEELFKSPANPATPPTPTHDPITYLLESGSTFFGRENELHYLDEWYASKRSICNVLGAPGIGKTRLCHRFLELWERDNPSQELRYIDMTNIQTANSFMAKLKDSLHLPETEFKTVIQALNANNPIDLQTSMKNLLSHIDKEGGILYLDNLEDPLQQDELVNELIKPLANLQTTRLLCSSRIELDTDIAQNIEVGRLDDAASIALFAEHWHRSATKTLNCGHEVQNFIHQKLDNHALSIKLVAAQARRFGSNATQLEAAWDKSALRLARKSKKNPGKGGSLEISFDLSFEALLKSEPSPIHVWALTAMFPEGMSLRAQECLMQEDWGILAPPDVLIKYNVLERDTEGRLQLLAPIRTYLLTRLRAGAGGLDWGSTLELVSEFLIAPILKANDFEASWGPEQHKDHSDELSSNFKNFAFFVEEAIRHSGNWVKQFSVLLEGYNFIFDRHAKESVSVLQKLAEYFKSNDQPIAQAAALIHLGNVHGVVGASDQAEKYYWEVVEIALSNEEFTYLGHSLKNLGGIYSARGETDKAIIFLQEAFGFYQEAGERKGMVSIGIELAMVLYRSGDLVEAREKIQLVIQIALEEKFFRHLSDAYMKAADIERVSQNFSKAEKHLNDGMALLPQNGTELADAKITLADVKLWLKDFNGAKKITRESYDLSKTLSYKQGEANAIKHLATIEIMEGRIAVGLKKLNEALEIYSGLHDNAGLAYSLALIAVCLNEGKDFENRDKATADAIHYARKSGSPMVVSDVTKYIHAWSKGE